jgi:phage shock protein E
VTFSFLQRSHTWRRKSGQEKEIIHDGFDPRNREDHCSGRKKATGPPSEMPDCGEETCHWQEEIKCFESAILVCIACFRSETSAISRVESGAGFARIPHGRGSECNQKEFKMTSRPRFEKLCSEAKARVREVSAANAAKANSEGALLIDVREAADFEKEHAAGAVPLSKGIIEMKIEEQVPDISAAIICYCGGGNRSALVADNLQKMGYQNVSSVTGGFKAWKDAGLPVES